MKIDSKLESIFNQINNLLCGKDLQLTYAVFDILFLKMYLPHERWKSLKSHNSADFFIQDIKTLIKDLKLSKIIFYFDNKINNTQPDNYYLLQEIYIIIDDLPVLNIDILGEAYQYFVFKGKLSRNSTTFFTPHIIAQKMVELIDPKPWESVYDPFCGSGSILREAYLHIKNDSHKGEQIFGSEITDNIKLAKMNMLICGANKSNLIKQDTLKNPEKFKYDTVITNIPFSLDITEKEICEKSGKLKSINKISSLYFDGLAKNSGDGVSLLHCFAAVKRGGRMIIIVPEGVLCNKNLQLVRQTLMKHARLEAVISLPDSVFHPYTKVRTSILYFTNCYTESTDQVCFVKADVEDLDQLNSVFSEIKKKAIH